MTYCLKHYLHLHLHPSKVDTALQVLRKQPRKLSHKPAVHVYQTAKRFITLCKHVRQRLSTKRFPLNLSSHHGSQEKEETPPWVERIKTSLLQAPESWESQDWGETWSSH